MAGPLLQLVSIVAMRVLILTRPDICGLELVA